MSTRFEEAMRKKFKHIDECKNEAKLIAKAYSVLVTGRAFEILDPHETAKKE